MTVGDGKSGGHISGFLHGITGIGTNFLNGVNDRRCRTIWIDIQVIEGAGPGVTGSLQNQVAFRHRCTVSNQLHCYTCRTDAVLIVIVTPNLCHRN